MYSRQKDYRFYLTKFLQSTNIYLRVEKRKLFLRKRIRLRDRKWIISRNYPCALLENY